MSFCNRCGAQIADGTTICSACATGTGTIPPPLQPAPLPTSNDNTMGLLAYFTLVPAVIFLVMEPYNRNRFIRFHSWQSLLFNVAWFVLWFVLRIIVHIPIFGWLTIFFWPIVFLAGFMIWVVLVLKAAQGQWFKLPVIGDLAEKQAAAL
jgi:uncharacterized membrane protein